jgi:hypothetical protein
LAMQPCTGSPAQSWTFASSSWTLQGNVGSSGACMAWNAQGGGNNVSGCTPPVHHRCTHSKGSSSCMGVGVCSPSLPPHPLPPSSPPPRPVSPLVSSMSVCMVERGQQGCPGVAAPFRPSHPSSVSRHTYHASGLSRTSLNTCPRCCVLRRAPGPSSAPGPAASWASTPCSPLGSLPPGSSGTTSQAPSPTPFRGCVVGGGGGGGHPPPPGPPPVGTPQQVQWALDEMACFIHFNMATAAGTQGCQGCGGAPPDIGLWNPYALDTDAWIAAGVAMGEGSRCHAGLHPPRPCVVMLGGAGCVPWLPCPQGASGLCTSPR